MAQGTGPLGVAHCIVIGKTDPFFWFWGHVVLGGTLKRHYGTAQVHVGTPKNIARLGVITLMQIDLGERALNT